MYVHLVITGKLRHHIEMTHSTIEIVLEPALNPELRPNTCLGMAQALEGWRGKRSWGAASTLDNMRALAALTGANGAAQKSPCSCLPSAPR